MAKISWAYLIFAAAAEVIYGIALYHSRGFTRLWPSMLGIAAGVATTWLLALAMKGLPISVAIVVWSGLAAVGTAIYGFVSLGEPRDVYRLSMIVMILAGVIGLKMTSN